MKNKIQLLKNDKSKLKEYVKCFCEGAKANELLVNNNDFQNLKNKTKEKKEF